MNKLEICGQFERGVENFGCPIMIAQVGSHAYGLNTPSSDEDYRGVFFPLEKYVYGLQTVEQVKVKGDDWVCHDIRQYVKLLLKQNPTIMELLFIPPAELVLCVKDWLDFLPHLKKLVTKKAFLPYSAYVRAQLQKAINRQPVGKRSRVVEELGYDTKFMSHCARLAVQCIALMQTGEIPVRVPLEYRGNIMAIKENKVEKSEAIAYIEGLDSKMHEAYKQSVLPEIADVETFESQVFMPYMKNGWVPVL